MCDMGWTMPITVHSGATAEIGIAKAQGSWQDPSPECGGLVDPRKIRSKQIKLLKVLGTENAAGIFTKHVDRTTLEKALTHTCAPVL